MNVYAFSTLLLIAMLVGCNQNLHQDSKLHSTEANTQARIFEVTWQFVGLKTNQHWLYQINTELDLEPVLLSFVGDKFSGQAACNGFFGQYKLLASEGSQAKISMADIATTRMLCPPEQMEREAELLSWLKKARSIAVINKQLIITLSNDNKLVFEQQNADIQSLSRYQACRASEGNLLLGANDNQCAFDGEVHFQDQRPSISLQYCSHYFDGCNNHIVTKRRLSASTLMACPQEFEPPVCYIDQRTYQKATGRVLKINSNSIDIVFDDIVEVFQIENKNLLKQLLVGNEVTVEYSQGHDYQDKILLNIWSAQ